MGYKVKNLKLYACVIFFIRAASLSLGWFIKSDDKKYQKGVSRKSSWHYRSGMNMTDQSSLYIHYIFKFLFFFFCSFP